MKDPEHGQHEREAHQDAGRQSDAAPSSRTLGRRAAAAYQGAIEAVIAVVITTGLGYWLDRRFETSPAFLFAGIGIGFASFVLRLWRMRDLMSGEPGNDGDEQQGRKSDDKGSGSA